jgi:hypothetical protein
MYSFSRYTRNSLTFLAAAFLSITVLQAQQAGLGSALTNTAASADSSDSSGYNNPAAPSVPTTKSPKWHETVVPASKQINAKVTSGVLTVDGLVAKVHLNYDIHHASYIYFFVPGVGTAVVSRVEMYGSTKVQGGLHGSTLNFKAGGHDFELSSQTAIGEGKGKSSDLFVRLDTDTVALDRMPMLGFGDITHAPYAWPLSGQENKEEQTHFLVPPPLPASVLPRTVPSASATTTTAAKMTAANDQTLQK